MFVGFFEDILKGDLGGAGGKGANLGELACSELPVPPGFVITTAGYRRFVESNELQERILLLATKPHPVEPAAYEAVSAQIHDLFMAGSMPGDLADEIRAAYDSLANRPQEKSTRANETAVAVRSSATAEDLPAASFAGQQETFLKMSGTEALLEAVKQYWASLWTARPGLP
jgi:rifampicin phosphotransferase